MGYSDLVGWMFNLERFGIKLGLENMREFSSRIGDPHLDFKTLHVTGTNGKGSVCAFTAEMLKRHGLKVGLYTSPHLVDFRERIRINGREISEGEVVRLGEELRGEMESMASSDSEKQLTFFEFTTGLAFKYFSEKDVDIVVTEVGMGGRLDATNIITPEVSAITRIGLEHTNYLGRTIPEIAREKAGIIKNGVGVVTCEKNTDALSVIESTCRRKGCALKRLGSEFDIHDVSRSMRGTAFDYRGSLTIPGLETRLLGAYQAENAAAAIAVTEELAAKGVAVSEEEIRKGISSTRWPGRLDVVSRKPFVMFDGSHNPDGVATTVRELTTLGMIPLTYVVACMDDKDARGIVRALAPTANGIIVTQARYKRALPASALGAIVKEEFQGSSEMATPSEVALERGLSAAGGKGMCAIGSLYLVGEAIQWWRGRGAKASTKSSHKV